MTITQLTTLPQLQELVRHLAVVKLAYSTYQLPGCAEQVHRRLCARQMVLPLRYDESSFRRCSRQRKEFWRSNILYR